MSEQLPKEEQFPELPAELRRAAKISTSGYWAGVMLTAADCIEQLQMPPAKVRELAECDEGADNLALIRALCMQVEGQRKHIAALQKDAARLNSNTILIKGRDEFGEPTSCIHTGLDLRVAIDAAMEQRS